MIKQCLLVLAVSILVVYYVQANEVKKSISELTPKDDQASGFEDKKKRSAPSLLDENEYAREGLNRYLQKLRNIIHEESMQAERGQAGLERAGSLLSRPSNNMEKYLKEDEDESDENNEDENDSDDDDDNNGSGENDNDDDDMKRRKKTLMKKKRFRMIYRKRNAQNRFKKFRAYF